MATTRRSKAVKTFTTKRANPKTRIKRPKKSR